MKQYYMIKKYSIFIVCISFLLFSGCYTSDGWGHFKWGDEPDSRRQHACTKKKGPPSHAPAHGCRAKYNYRYYPGSSVYFDSVRGVYFYFKGDNWTISTSLPDYIRLNIGSYVNIEMDTDKPYIKHKEHSKKYPPSKFKKKKGKKKKW